MEIELKCGKLPFEPDDRDIRLETLLDMAAFPKSPESTNDYMTFVDWLMFLNDKIGCCGIAGAYHLLMLWLKQGGKTPEFTDDQILEVYEEVSGYNPNDPSTDTGVVLRDVLKLWKNEGLPDKNGELHKIGAFALVNWKDHRMVKIAQYLFSGLYMGFKVPAFALELFQKGEIWDLQKLHDYLVGGHCVVPAGYGKFVKKSLPIKLLKIIKEGVWVITWGKVQFLTWAFWDKYVDELWVIFDPEFLDNNKSPDGFDSNQLNTFLNEIAAEA